MPHPRYSAEETAARGRAIYEDRVRASVEPDQIGKYLVIDIDTGDYEIDEDHLAASRRAYEKNPNGARYALRIGHPAIGRIGFAPRAGGR